MSLELQYGKCVYMPGQGHALCVADAFFFLLFILFWPESSHTSEKRLGFEQLKSQNGQSSLILHEC